MKEQINKLKQELKGLVQTIKTDKPLYRQTVSEYDKSSVPLVGWNKVAYFGKDPKLSDKAYKLKNSVERAKHEFRHKHIAYCMLRGRTLKQIESAGQRCEKDHRYGCNCPSMNLVNQYIKEIQDEALRNSQVGSIEVAASSTSGTCLSPDAPVGSTEQAAQGVEQQHSDISEGEKPGVLAAVKRLFR